MQEGEYYRVILQIYALI